MSKPKKQIHIASHSGKITLGDVEVPVHVLPGGLPIVEITSIESMIGLPESGLGAFLASLPGTDRIEFMRSSATCAVCAAPASHVECDTGTMVCGKHMVQSKKRCLTAREWGVPDVKVVGVPADKIVDLLQAYWLANPTTEAGNKPREILRMLLKAGLRATAQNPEAADFIMAAAAPRRAR